MNKKHYVLVISKKLQVLSIVMLLVVGSVWGQAKYVHSYQMLADYSGINYTNTLDQVDKAVTELINFIDSIAPTANGFRVFFVNANPMNPFFSSYDLKRGDSFFKSYNKIANSTVNQNNTGKHQGGYLLIVRYFDYKNNRVLYRTKLKHPKSGISQMASPITFMALDNIFSKMLNGENYLGIPLARTSRREALSISYLTKLFKDKLLEFN